MSRFGTATDAAGNVYVADTDNNTIRKMTPVGTNWVVTTLAGMAGSYGSVDDTGSAARFYNPQGLVVDGAGNVYVSDTGNSTIRKVTPAGVVTTLAGLAGFNGTNDGTGNTAQFQGPYGLALDHATNLYVADIGNATIRKVTREGVVTTLAGLGGFYGTNDGTGSEARFQSPFGMAVDSATNVYVGDFGNATVRKVTPAGVVDSMAGDESE